MPISQQNITEKMSKEKYPDNMKKPNNQHTKLKYNKDVESISWFKIIIFIILKNLVDKGDNTKDRWVI